MGAIEDLDLRRDHKDSAYILKEAEKIASRSIARIKAQAGMGGGIVVHRSADGSRSGGAKFPFGISETGGLNLDHWRLRTNARDAYHDTPQARALVERYADTVADIGLMFEPAPKAEVLGISAEQAERWARNTEECFDSWCRARTQNRSEQMNWYQSHRLYQIFQHRDNDIFIRLYYSRDQRLLNPLQFEFLDANQIRGDAWTGTAYVNGMQDDGINRDERGREKTYKVWVSSGPGKYTDVTIPRVGARSGRIMMLHGYTPEYAGQGRGYSRLAFALQEFENLTDFSISTIKKAINQSQVTMYVKPALDSPASNPMEGLLSNAGVGPAALQFGADPNPSDAALNVTSESTNPVKFYQMPEATHLAPGSTSVFNLEAGEDLRPFEGKVASESFNTFVDSFCGYLSAAMSMPLEVLLMKFNQNYSASRGTLILFWRVAMIWREEMISDYCGPVYEMWLSEEIAAGRIACPGWSDPRLRAAWLNGRWIGSPMPNIDPKQTAEADAKYVEMGAQTLDRVSRNLNGSSGKANRAKLKRELSELTPVPWSKGKGSASGEDEKKKEADNA